MAPSSPANFRLITDAFDDYAMQVGEDLTKNPSADALRACNSPNAILELLQEKAHAFKEYRDGDHKLISGLKPVVQVVQGFSGLLGEAISFVPFPPASAIFVGVNVLLTAATGVSSSYDSLVDLFECLGNFLKRLEIYTAIPATPLMTDIIVKIMAELLSVFALATKQVQQGRFKKFAKKLLGESEIEAVLQKLDRLTGEEARMMAAQTLEVVHCLVNNVKVVMDDGKASIDGVRNILVTMQGIASEINKMKRDQLQKDARNWISPPDPSKNYNIASEIYQTGTGVWFFQGGVFSEWCSKGTLLWIHGKPGSGKTILISGIIRDIDRLCAAGFALMAYYYFDFRDTEKQHRRGLLSSLLCQLCAESDPCYEILSRLYSTHAGGTREPSDSALARCLMDMLQLEEQPAIYIIVDALDECSNSSGMPTPREKVLEFLEDLIVSELPNVRLCISSRPEFDIRSVLEPLASFRVSLHDETGQKKDIQDYVSAVVHSDRKMRKWRAPEKQLVIDTLSERADGMFRWVFCQLETLRHSFPAAIRHTLDKLPETLDETYEQILLGIEKAKRNSSYRLFQCLSVAIRPLRVEELAEVLALRFDPGQSAEYRADWRPEDSHEAVLTACSSLVTVVDVDGSQVVQFSHFSVKEFLTSDRLATARPELSRYHVVPHLAHTLLAQACLSVLLHLDDRVDKDSIKDLPLAFYAAKHWVDHCQFEYVLSIVLDDVERLFDRDKPHFSTWVWLFDIDRPFKGHTSTALRTDPGATSLYYAVLCGFRGLVERLLDIRPEDVNSTGGYFWTPLHAALAKRHIDIAILLLQRGADVNAPDDEDNSPLATASASGRVDLVQLLLEHHADINPLNATREAPLSAASSKGELEVVRVLLQNGADIEACDDKGQPVITIASENGHPEIVQLLLESGAKVDTRDDNGETPLKTASRNAYSDVVRLLVDHGADLNCPDNDGGTPLHAAPDLDIVQQLLDHGADVNIRDNEGQTALHRTLVDDQLDIVRYFLTHGTEVDILNGERKTPLAMASADGQVETSRYLIEQGANVHASDDGGWTPLFWASRYGRLDTARLLLDHGADVNSQEVDLWTPLYLASVHGHIEVAKLLVERGADINKKTGDEETPLFAASGHGMLEVARFLIECGSDVNSRDNIGGTPLHDAAQEGHFGVVMLLLEHGADINVRNNSDQSPLDLAVEKGKRTIATLLATRMGVDLPETPSQSLGPSSEGGSTGRDDKTSDAADEVTLHTASQSGRLDVVRMLLDGRANVDSRNDDGNTPLVLATSEGRLDVVRLLIDRGADVNSRNKSASTPLHEASWAGHVDITRLLLDRGADIEARADELETPLDLAALKGRLEIVRLLVDRGADRDCREKKGWTPLHEACWFNHVDVAQFFLDRGTDIHTRNGDYETPLYLAASGGKVEAVRLLISRGADVNCCNEIGWTPLHEASYEDHGHVMRLLLDHGADINATNHYHWTALHMAASNGHRDITQLLLERGANVDVVNDDGRTPYQEAMAAGYRKIAKLLSNRGSQGR